MIPNKTVDNGARVINYEFVQKIYAFFLKNLIILVVCFEESCIFAASNYGLRNDLPKPLKPKP